MNTRYGRSDKNRTCDLLNPIQARYQTALHPDGFTIFLLVSAKKRKQTMLFRCQPRYYSTIKNVNQTKSARFLKLFQKIFYFSVICAILICYVNSFLLNLGYNSRNKQKRIGDYLSFFLAEKSRFELELQLPALLPQQGSPFGHLGISPTEAICLLFNLAYI